MKNQDDSSNSNSSINLWPTILIFLSLIGIIPNIDYLKSSRPNESEWAKHAPKIGTGGRLWEDPLAVAARYENTINNKEKKVDDVNEENILQNITDDLVQNLETPYGERTTNVLYIFLPEGGFIEDAELRRRFRYAVTSALSSSCLIPEDSGSLKFLEYSFNHQPIFIPYEWYIVRKSYSSHCTHSEKLAKTLVVWLREDLITSTSMRRFFSDPPANTQYIPKFIGPIQSSKLKDIQNEFEQEERIRGGSDKAGPLLISPFATISLNDKPIVEPSSFAETLDEENDKNLPIIRTIGTDNILAATLVWELHERGINDCEDELILISEIDSDYVLSLTDSIEGGFSHDCTRVVHKYNYMRGVDGKTPSMDNKKDSSSNKNTSGHTSKQLRDYFDGSSFESAEGTDQYDYLLRLFKEINKLDSIQKVKAIGIIGNDVYDKLLILRALNRDFKNKLFFTTDLDARFLHSEEKKWTRNLVVASNFGLTLRPELQSATPPFRDSYQTSLYFSVLLALQEHDVWQKDLANWLQPRVFEIGNSEAIAIPRSPSKTTLQRHFSAKENIEDFLAIEKNCTLADISRCVYIHPDDSEKVSRLKEAFSLSNLLKLLVISFLFCLWVFITNPKELHKKLFKLLICYVCFVFLIVIITYCLIIEAKEPISLLEGASIWPVFLIRCLGLCIVTVMFFIYKEKMHDQMVAIHWQFKFKFLKIETAKNTINSFRDKFREICDACITGPHIDFAKYSPKNRSIETNQIWQKYLQATKCGRMGPWIALSVIIIFIFAGMAFYSWGPPAFPHRGAVAFKVNWLLLLPCIIFLWVSVFWVGYEAKIIVQIIKLFRNERNRWDPKRIQLIADQKKQNFSFLRNMDEKLQSNYLNFQFIAALSERIGKLIFLPFVTIFFMVIARNELFEKLDFPVTLILLSLTAVLYVLFAFNLVRLNAVKLRDQLLDQCQIELSRDYKQAESINQLINSINATKKGVYASFTQRPAIQALLLPLSGLGGNELINYLMNFF